MRMLIRKDNSIVMLDTEKDVCLYQAPHNPPNTGTRYTRGVDLFVKPRKGEPIYYLCHWSMWQGEEGFLKVITKKQALDFVIESSGDYWDFPDDNDIERLKKYGIDLKIEK